MKNHRSTKVAAAALCAVLAACGHTPKAPDAGQAGVTGNDNPGATVAAQGTGDATTALPQQRTQYSSLNVYKSDAALHILQRNAEHTFTGALPPMLPAIVVLRVTVEPNGKLHQVTVQRSRDDTASQVALASMRRTAYLPMPRNLGVEAGGRLTFMETFLFNEAYRFQIRTLAPVQ